MSATVEVEEMTPERVTPESVLYIVQEHERRLDRLESSTEDINVMRKDLARIEKHVHDIRSDVAGIRHEMTLFANQEDVSELRRAWYTFAVSIAGSSLLFAITLFAIFK